MRRVEHLAYLMQSFKLDDLIIKTPIKNLWTSSR